MTPVIAGLLHSPIHTSLFGCQQAICLIICSRSQRHLFSFAMTSSSPPHIVRGPKNEGQPGVSGQSPASLPSPPLARSAGPRAADTKDAERVVEQGGEEGADNDEDNDNDDDDDDDDRTRAGEDAGAASGESKKRPAAEEQQERASKSNVKRTIEQVTSSSSSSAAPSPAAASEDDNAVSAESADNKSAAKERHASASAAPARESSSGPSVKPLDEADLMTGEEEENVLVSARAKLYVLGDDHQSWKEKGTGTLRCNIPRRKSPLELARTGGSSQSSKRGGRLVMRTEGILRLILNVNLFPSMKLELISDRFLRFVAFEAAAADAPRTKLRPTHYGLRFGSAAAASNFVDVVDSLLGEMQKHQNSSKIVEEA
ncbi:Ran-binding protein RANBP3 [Ceraceosorus bombacis]|uniref:Ran-binding protein RANBP3 n=1 Tax=Ceraceosorus bombacis TaxID=401625 RepID=A0A0P1BPK3_9BASI|nr:Ran-binding protein RANBP3 [Ceraceosorus bombacis]